MRRAALVAGTAGLTAAWLAAGALTPGYDTARLSISQLQRSGAPTAGGLTAAFVGFAAGALAFAPVLRRQAGEVPAVALRVVAVATLGAAASPLGRERGGPADLVHYACGSTGYVALCLVPLSAAVRLRGRERVAATAAGLIAAVALLLTTVLPGRSGMLQRVGFLAVHGWLVVTAVRTVEP